MAGLSLQNISKTYEGNLAVKPLSLSIPAGCFFALLGPSGCGKTTLLRMVAGLISPDDGKILIGEKDVTSLVPEKRQLGMVFQNYALFPNMTVFQNVAFGLKVRKFPANEIRKKVQQALAMVDLTPKIDRLVPALSGGEQQRVALARAVVTEPDVLLFDEPLSNLDARLRVETRLAIRQLVSRLKITTIYVTHDQEEALSLADELAVMRSGNIIQTGSPIQVYESPATPFVASFLGRANLFLGKRNSESKLQLENGFSVGLDSEFTESEEPLFVLIRPEDLNLVEASLAWVSGEIVAYEFLGAHLRIQVKPEKGPIWEALLDAKEKKSIGVGKEVYLAGNQELLRFYQKDDR